MHVRWPPTCCWHFQLKFHKNVHVPRSVSYFVCSSICLSFHKFVYLLFIVFFFLLESFFVIFIWCCSSFFFSPFFSCCCYPALICHNICLSNNVSWPVWLWLNDDTLLANVKPKWWWVTVITTITAIIIIIMLGVF